MLRLKFVKKVESVMYQVVLRKKVRRPHLDRILRIKNLHVSVHYCSS